jgi:hypothetical protein
MTENVHQQRVRAVARVEFTSARIVTEEHSSRGGMNFGESPVPVRSLPNPPVRGRKEVPMPAGLVLPIQDGGHFTYAYLVSVTSLQRPPDIALAQLATEICGVREEG